MAELADRTSTIAAEPCARPRWRSPPIRCSRSRTTGGSGSTLSARPRCGADPGADVAAWYRAVIDAGVVALARAARASSGGSGRRRVEMPAFRSCPISARCAIVAPPSFSATRCRACIAQMDRGAGSEFETLAEYRPGMDRRSIDWKQSARHLKLHAKQYRPERNAQLAIVLDAGRQMSDPGRGRAPDRPCRLSCGPARRMGRAQAGRPGGTGSLR